MFKRLTDLGYRRSTVEAIGFYLAYLLLTMLVSGILSAVVGVYLGDKVADAYQLGVKIGNLTAIIVSMGITFLVLWKKRLLNNFGYILLALLAGVLAVFIGGLAGLMPVAYLTTRKKHGR